MFAHSERIPRETLEAFRGRKAANAYFSLRVAANQLSRNRFAIAVGKKVDPRSSRRHTLKRRAAPMLKAVSLAGYDLFLSILPPANPLPREDFFKELEMFLKNAFRDSYVGLPAGRQGSE